MRKYKHSLQYSRGQGRSHIDGYYLHEEESSPGLYWIIKTLRALEERQRFPRLLNNPRLSDARAAFIHHLADNFSVIIRHQTKLIHAAVRHYETFKLLERIIDSNKSNDLSAAAAFVHAEAAYSNSLIEYLGDTRCAHLYWLNPDHENRFRNLPGPNTDEAEHPLCNSIKQRNNIYNLYPQHVKNAACDARSYCSKYIKDRRLWFREYRSLCHLRPNAVARSGVHKMIRGDSLHESDPAWADRFVDALQFTYDADVLAWQKTIFRMTEPDIRKNEFLKAESSNKCPQVGKAHLDWEFEEGRYYGMNGTSHASLLNSMQCMDKRCADALFDMNVLPTSDNRLAYAGETLESFFRHTQSGYVMLQLIF